MKLNVGSLIFVVKLAISALVFSIVFICVYAGADILDGRHSETYEFMKLMFLWGFCFGFGPALFGHRRIQRKLIDASAKRRVLKYGVYGGLATVLVPGIFWVILLGPFSMRYAGPLDNLIMLARAFVILFVPGFIAGTVFGTLSMAESRFRRVTNP
ncbi:MAG: hypothetical protein AAGI14_01520 [Pseudomonadota bacterium]